MANFSRSIFFGAMVAAVLAAFSGRGWLAAVFAAAATGALFLFVGDTKEQIIPLSRWFYPVSFTKAGWAVWFFVIFVFVSAIQSGAPLLFFLGSVMTAGLVLSWVYSWLSLRRVTVEVRLAPWMFAGEKATGRLVVRNDKRILPIVALFIEGAAGGICPVRAALPHLSAGARASIAFEMKATGRGVVSEADIEVSTSGLVGLTRRRKKITVPVESVCYPALAEVELPVAPRRRRETGRAFASREGDFAGLREWRPGDNPKHIHYRSSARAGRLLAKEFVLPERSELIVVFDTYGEEGEAFEAAVSRAAGLAVAAGGASLGTTLVYFNGGVRRVTEEGPSLPHHILTALAEISPQRECAIGELKSHIGLSAKAFPQVVEVGPEPSAPGGNAAVNAFESGLMLDASGESPPGVEVSHV